ncbi:MAG: alpha-amylase, partial [Gemmatimonadota bacterium]
MRYSNLILLCLALVCCSCETEPNLAVPSWAKDAVWYQIFVERFRNGDDSNDPTLHDIVGSWPHMQPAGWEL